MTTLVLDDADRQILRDCPITIRPSLKPSKADLTRMSRIKRLWTAAYVSGEVGTDGRTLTVRIKDLGRVAIGRVPLAGGVVV